MSAIAHTVSSLTSSSGKAKVLAKHDDDVVIVSAVRSAITKAKKGGFKDTYPEELLSGVLRASYTKIGLDPALIEDITVGNVLPAGGGANAARMAGLHAGIPISTPVSTVNRQCSSGLTAVNDVANQIISGQIDLGLSAGVESMSFGYNAGANPEGFSDTILAHPLAADCLIPMGITSENVAAEHHVPRVDQDAFAARSFQKAAKAQKAGRFTPEIVPLTVPWVDPKTEAERTVVIDADDGIRDGVTAESLGKLRPAFAKDGTTHAGNASQVSDGASAIILARRSVAKKLGLTVLGKYVCAAVVGVPPRIMGVGPLYAIPRALEKAGLRKEDVDFFEINEAFASQALYCIRGLGIDEAKVNLFGGAIALGHPLGATGARQIVTGLNIAKQTGGKIFVTSMCIGSGMGMAGVFVSEQ